MEKMEIKHRWDESILFSGKFESMKTCVEAAVSAGVSLAGANLAGVNLTGANLAGARLADAIFTDAFLADANFTDTYLAGANFTDAYLADTYFTDAYLAGAIFIGAYLTDANLEGVDLTDAFLADAYLGGVNLTGATWGGVPCTKPPIQVFGLRYRVTILDSHIKIGCELYSLFEWQAFTDEQIVAMDGKNALTFWRQNKEGIMSIARGGDRNFSNVAVR